MIQTVSGSCLCGAVRFEAAADFSGMFLCHCSRCRKGTGSAHASNLFSTTPTFNWLSGEDSVRTYKVQDSRHQRSFCVNCGSALPALHMNGALLVVPAGSLDDKIDVRPTAHICYASRAEWDERMDDVPKMDGLPGAG